MGHISGGDGVDDEVAAAEELNKALEDVMEGYANGDVTQAGCDVTQGGGAGVYHHT
jgi:hypothetical protein